jgi:hypothetical protein
MATYKVIVDGLKGYGVEIQRASGFQSRRGFTSYMEALQWIDERRADERRNAAVEVAEDCIARQVALLAKARAARLPVDLGGGPNCWKT